MADSPESLNTLDISRFLANQSTPSEDRQLAASFVQLAKDVGFFYVSGSESLVPQELVDEVFAYVRVLSRLCASMGAVEHARRVPADPFSPLRQNERFFNLPLEKKDALAYTSCKANRGYLSFGREQASLSKDPDQIGAEREAAKDQKCVLVFSPLAHSPHVESRAC